MNYIKTLRIAFMAVLCTAAATLTFRITYHAINAPASADAQEQFGEVLSKQGSRGEEVKAIQLKLRELGYLLSSADGIFGPRTLEALKKFQKAKGLTVDGIAGPQTLKALGISTSSQAGISQNELDLLAQLISAEARGEPYNGQVAVGAVVLNRVKHPSFPNSISAVIYQPLAFSCIDDGQFYEPIAESSRRAARDAINGVDPSGGAIYYYNPKTATSKWILNRPVIGKIGAHLFCM